VPTSGTRQAQHHRIGSADWADGWNGLAPFDRSTQPILHHLLDQGFIDRDGETLLVGPSAEQRFGHRHFMDMTAVFTAAPQFTVLAGRQDSAATVLAEPVRFVSSG
jgi:ATP-dependent Lhr-like helicase